MAVTNFLGGGGVNLSATQALVDRLEEAVGVYPLLNYNVVNTLSNCSTDNDASTVQENRSYTANITAGSGWTLEGASVLITMGGVDITSTAYSSGTISIASVTGDLAITISAVASGSPIYGVSWTNDTTTTMTRTDDSVGKTFAINSSTGAISSDFNNVFPWNETEIITDTNNNKFLHFPDMYFRIGKDANGDINSVAVSKTQGSEGNWYKCDAFDYGIYGGSLNGTKLESKTGQTRLGSATRAQFRTYAGNNSETGYTYHQLDLKHKIVTMFLWWIEWATKDSSTIMTGHISGSPSSSGVKVATGGTDSVTTPSGYNTSTWQMRYHYIEDFIGNQLEFIDGAVFNTDLYTTDNPAYFNDTGANMTASGITRTSSGGACAIAVGWNDSKPFLSWASKTVNNSSYNTGFCDGWYNTDTTNPVVYSGAHYYTARASAGLSCFNLNAVSSSDDCIGGRLLRQ